MAVRRLGQSAIRGTKFSFFFSREFQEAQRKKKGGLEAAFKKVLDASENPEKLKEEVTILHLSFLFFSLTEKFPFVKMLARFEKVRSPFRTAEIFGIEEIIDPR